MFIPGYKLERKLGQGGMAVVYLAIQESLQRPVALKVLNPAFSDTPAFSERFLNEGQILASLRHSNIITIHDIGVVGDLHYISMEYVEGSDLRAKIKQGISPEHALTHVSTIASCLATAHVKNIVHRDIKPANILFRSDDTLLLTDFGIAKRMDGQDITEVGTTLGSPSYLSPEQAQSKEVDGRSDIYSVGVIAYEMLTGNKPYRGATDIDTIVMHINEPVPRLPEHLGMYQPLLDRMLAKQPQERFANAADIVGFIEALGEPGATPSPAGATTFFTRVTEDPSDVPEVTKTLILRPGDGEESRAVEAFPPPSPGETGPPGSPSMARRALYAGFAGAALLGTLGAFGLYQQNETPPSAPGTALVEHPDKTHSLLRRLETSPKATLASTANNTQAGNGQPIEEEEPTLTLVVEHHEVVPQTRYTRDQRPPPVVGSPQKSLVSSAPTPPQPLTAPPAPVAKPAKETAKAPAAGAKVVDKTPPAPVTQQKPPTPQVAMAPPPEPKVEPVVKVDEAEIERLLGNANAAIAANRLTDPSGHNALDYYKDVLELDPNNPQAQSGFTRIGNRYAWLARQALSSYETKSAEHYVERGLEVDPYNRALLSLRSKMQATARDLTIVEGSNRFQEESNVSGRERKRYKRVGETPGALVKRIKRFFD